MAKAVKASGSRRTSTRSQMTPEARENYLIALATDLAEQRLLDGTASNQLVVEFVRRGSTKAQLEKEYLSRQTELAAAKADSIKSIARSEELLEKAMKALKRYGGQEDDSDEEY